MQQRLRETRHGTTPRSVFLYWAPALFFMGSSLNAAEPKDCTADSVFQGTLVVLHGFIKKTRKTLADDLALAKRRMKEVTT